MKRIALSLCVFALLFAACTVQTESKPTTVTTAAEIVTTIETTTTAEATTTTTAAPTTTTKSSTKTTTTQPTTEPIIYTYKPAIYLYPKTPTQVDVTLTLRSSTFTKTIPPYNTDWRVLAQPNGQLTNLADGKTYPYLFWEALGRKPWPEAKEGFVVHRDALESFFREKLAFIGLIPVEYEEFIDFWLPLLAQTEYILISFAGEAYTKRYPLEITPAPDSLLRVFMIARPATGREKIAPQTLQPFTRKGFAVIEWGGTLLE